MIPFRAWAEIDVDSLAHNLRAIRARCGAARAIILVVKADAYGHGAVAIAHHARRLGVSAFGVGTAAEALELRAAGITEPLLVLGTVVDEEVGEALACGVEIGLHSMDRCRMLERLARSRGLRARVHLKVDTGMGRLGVLPERALALLERIRGARHLELAGVMTHVAAADGALSASAREQLACFDRVLQQARERDVLAGRVHAANSACLFTGIQPLYDAVRPGISAYGVLPAELPGARELRPIMSLRSQVVFLKDVPAGAAVGYDATFRAERRTRVATIPVGYNDGVPWRLSNCGEVLVRGRRAPIIGRVSMDYTSVDATDVRDLRVGDPVTIIGRDGEQSIPVEEVARRAGTIAYEITCSIGKRVKRVYRSSADAEHGSPHDAARPVHVPERDWLSPVPPWTGERRGASALPGAR